MTIYVGNLNYRTGEQDLSDLFSQYGEVQAVKMIKDNFTGKSRGFAFVEMTNDDEGQAAIQALHETDFMQRKLVVNEARPRTNDRPRGGRDGGRDGGYNRDRED